MPAIYLAEFLQGTAAVTAAVRLLSLGLGRAQTALISFVSLNAAALLVLGSLPVASATYFWSFIAYTIVNWAVSFWAVREMFALSLSAYPGIRTAARWGLYASVALAFLVSLAVTASAWGAGRNGRSNYFYVQVADRSITFSLAVVVAGLILFLSRYPLHLRRNTYISCSFFSAILLCQAADDLIDSFMPHFFSNHADIAEVLICGIAFLGWATLLRPETAPSVKRVSFERPDEMELLHQLDAVNQLLTRVGRR